MKYSTHIHFSDQVEESENFSEGNRVKRFCRGSWWIICLVIHELPILSRYVRLARGRRKLEPDHTRKIKQLKDIDNKDCTRRVYHLSENPDGQNLGHHFFSQIIKNCKLVGPGLVPCIDGFLVSDSIDVGNNNDTKFASAESRQFTKQERYLPGKYASLCSHWSYWKGYYHWMLDLIPMLDLIDEDRKILVNSPLADYEKESLELLGVWDRCVEVTENHLLVEDFQLITLSSSTGVFNPFAVNFVHERILRGMQDELKEANSYGKKVYLSRHGGRRAARNESALINCLESYGWDIIHAEELSFKQQVQLVNSAEWVMGVHGANLTNILWGRRARLKVVEFIPSNRPVPSNENIAICLDFEYHAIICKSFSDGSLEIDMSLLKKVLSSNVGREVCSN